MSGLGRFPRRSGIARLAERRQLTPRMIRVTLACEGFRDGWPIQQPGEIITLLFVPPGEEIVLPLTGWRFPDGAPEQEWRNYTVRRHDREAGEIEVDGKYIPAGADGNEIVFMPGSLLSLMTGYKIKPGYHQVRNTRRRDPRSSLLLFVNPEIDQKLEPWINNESNAGIDIIERANEGPKQFGMPTLVDGTAGEAFPELMEHKEAVLAEQSQLVRAKG